MKKRLFAYVLALCMAYSLCACGGGPDQGQTSKPEWPAGAASSALPDGSNAALSEEEVRRLVLEMDPEAKIAAVVSWDIISSYQYNGERFFVDLGTITGLDHLSDSCSSRLSALNEANEVSHSGDGQGYLIFLEKERLPSYYVEEGSVWLTRSGLVGSKDKYWWVFPVRDEETLLAFQDTLSQAKDDLLNYANELEQLQYVISGEVKELNEDACYMLLYGTAERYSTGDYYQGMIRLGYDKEGEEWVNQDYIYYVSAYSWEDTHNNNDGDWFGYQVFSSVADAHEGYALEKTYESIDKNVDFMLKILRNTPPLEGTDYEKTIDGWRLRFTVPEEWTSICDIETAENVVSFYQKASRTEMGGWLFDLTVMEGTGYLEIPHYEILAEEEGATLLAIFPTDVQFDGNTMAEYEEMQSRISEILDTVEFEQA